MILAVNRLLLLSGNNSLMIFTNGAASTLGLPFFLPNTLFCILGGTPVTLGTVAKRIAAQGIWLCQQIIQFGTVWYTFTPPLKNNAILI